MDIYVKRQGSEDNTVTIRLTAAQYKRVCEFYQIKTPIFAWSAAGILAQGKGWYRLYSRNGKVDGALAGLRHVQYALFTDKERAPCRPALLVERNELGDALSFTVPRRTPDHGVVHGHRFVVKSVGRRPKAVCRKLQIAYDLQRAVTEEIKRMFELTGVYREIERNARLVELAHRFSRQAQAV